MPTSGGKMRIPASPPWQCWAALAFAAKLMLAFSTIGTNDATAYRVFAISARRHGGPWLYEHAPAFIHPPFMVHFLSAMAWAWSLTGVPLEAWMRTLGSIADLGSLFLVARLTGAGRIQMAILAMAPASILVTGFHCNTDPIMIFLLLASIYVLKKKESQDASAILLGVAASIKLVPFFLLPAILSSLHCRRIRYVVLSTVTWSALSLPYLLQAPQIIARNTLGYRSNSGTWGFSLAGLLTEILTGRRLYPFSIQISSVAMLVALLALPFWFRRANVPLFDRCGITLLAFLFLAPGFGVQYLLWLVPFTATLAIRMTLALHAACGLFLAGFYTYFCGGFPWYYADASRSIVYRRSPFSPMTGQGIVDLLAILAWLTVGMVLAWRLREMSLPKEEAPAGTAAAS
jgi:hypothetical protein